MGLIVPLFSRSPQPVPNWSIPRFHPPLRPQKLPRRPLKLPETPSIQPRSPTSALHVCQWSAFPRPPVHPAHRHDIFSVRPPAHSFASSGGYRLTPVKSRTETIATREAQKAPGRPAAAQLKASSPLLMLYRVILWVTLAAYPFFLKGMHAASDFSNPLVVRGLGFLGLACTCVPAAMALFCLHELPKVN